jgi:hypothetical protein
MDVHGLPVDKPVLSLVMPFVILAAIAVLLLVHVIEHQQGRRCETWDKIKPSESQGLWTLSIARNSKLLENTKRNSVAWVCERTISTERPLVPTFADRECLVVSVTDPYGRILAFIDRSRYFFFLVAPQLYPRGWVDPVLNPLLLRKPGSAGDRTRTSGSAARNSDH